MGRSNTLDRIASQDWLSPVENGLHKAVHSVYEKAGPSGQKVKNFLHGTWLGTPLHPAITDLPVGAWTAAAVMDGLESITGQSAFGRGADSLIAIGLAGAAGAAITGLTDWHDTDGRARRLGLVHASLNTLGVALFTTSYILRKRRARRAGLGFSLLGFAVAATAAHLGGDLVYTERVGVNRTAGIPYPEEFKAVIAESELAEGKPARVEVDGASVLLCKRGDRITAIGETCSHMGGPLAEGEVVDGSVKCPWHGSRFSLEDGQVIDGPSVHAQPCFETRVREGQVEIRLAHR